MSTARQRLGRLEGAVPYRREPIDVDVLRLTLAQRERRAEINERVLLAGILVAPVWPIPETLPVEITTGRTR